MSISRNEKFRRFKVQALFIIGIYVVLTVLMALGVIDSYTVGIMTTATVYAIIALGLNLVTGMTGQLLLGQAGFMSIGGYTAAILLKNGFPMLPSLLIAATIAAVAGLLIGLPLFRLRGDYLAIVTLAIGEIIVVVMNNLGPLTGGASGLPNIRNIAVSGPFSTLVIFLWTSIFLVLTVIALVHLLTSSHGRAIVSVRDDEIASESMGINIHYMKVFAFVFSTFLAGLGGGLFATEMGYLNPSQFNFLQSINLMVFVVFGGLGSLTGTVLACYVLLVLQEKLRIAESMRLVIYPLLLILMMIFRPQGLLGTRELKVTELFTKEGMKKACIRILKWLQSIPLIIPRFFKWVNRIWQKIISIFRKGVKRDANS